MRIPEYITDITREDLKELARAAKPVAGLGMEIEPKGDGIQFSISESQFKRMVWAFMKNCGVQMTAQNPDEVSIDIEGQ
ncbi:MAG: hypothetical protein J6V72_09205 [Kiritimatiellae bacterium]|nr:hypothetical protein [Kiritimatiellia bacterium]